MMSNTVLKIYLKISIFLPNLSIINKSNKTINNISKIKSLKDLYKSSKASKMEEFKQKFQLLTDICRYFEPTFTYQFSLLSHVIIQFHYANYINEKINKTKYSKTWINKLVESLLQSSCYKISYIVSHKPQLFLLHSYQEIHLRQT